MSIHFSMTPKGRSFMVTSSDHGRQLLGLLGYPPHEGQKLKVKDLRRRFKAVKGAPPIVRDYLTTLWVVTDHLLGDDTIYAR